jgi:hypothetical protein
MRIFKESQLETTQFLEIKVNTLLMLTIHLGSFGEEEYYACVRVCVFGSIIS